MSYSKIYLLKVNFLVMLLALLLLVFTPVTTTVAISFIATYLLAYVVGFNMFHRYWAHKQFMVTKFFQIIFAYLGLFTMAGDPLTIARTHRYHHKHADTEKDLHSPIHGRLHSFIGWMLKDNNTNIPLSTVRDLLTPEYDYLKFYLKHQIKIIWITLLVVGFFSTETLLGLTLGMCFNFVLEMGANTFNHSIETKSAKNNMAYAYLTMNAPHLDHHTNPNLTDNDPGKYMLDIFSKLKILSYR
jgi:fatty-acid desaturase